MDTYIIAEIGVNHNGKIKVAKKLIDHAKAINADAVKFQNYKTEELVLKSTKLARYQAKTSFSDQFKMLKKFELSSNDTKKIYDYCKLKKIQFISTPFDIPSLNLLLKLNVPILKISSGDLNNDLLLYRIGLSNKKVILSTGMSTIKEIKRAIDILAFSNIYRRKKNHFPTKKNLSLLKNNKKKREDYIKNQLTILHCTTDYPAKDIDLKLSFIRELSMKLNVKVGYSDHSKDTTSSILAYSFGARIFERHFTLSNKMKGPDHRASSDLDEMKKYIYDLKRLSKMCHKKTKISNIEKNNKKVIRKKIVASTTIKKGSNFTIENLTLKRANKGVQADKYFKYLGKMSKKNYKKNEII